MHDKTSLHDFQAYLAGRLSGVAGQPASSLLGVESGGECWLVDLAEAGEIVPLPRLTAVPLTVPFFVGLANVRGQLHGVTDFAAFRGALPTPQEAPAHLLLVGNRFGSNAALLVDRLLGLRKPGEFSQTVTPPEAPAWDAGCWLDQQGRSWRRLHVPGLLASPEFMHVGLSGPTGDS